MGIPPLVSHCTPLTFGTKSALLSTTLSKGHKRDVAEGDRGDFCSPIQMKGYVLPGGTGIVLPTLEDICSLAIFPQPCTFGDQSEHSRGLLLSKLPNFLPKRTRHAQRQHAPSPQPNHNRGLLMPLHTSTHASRSPPSPPPEDAGIIPTALTGASAMWAAAEKGSPQRCLLPQALCG